MQLKDGDAGSKDSRPAEASRVRILAASDLGQLRVCEAPSGQLEKLTLVQTWGTPERARGIECLAVSPTSSSVPSALIAVGLRGGDVDIRSSADGEIIATVEASTSSSQEDISSIRGLHFVRDSEISNRRVVLLLCTSTGFVRLLAPPDTAADPRSQQWQEVASWQGPAKVLATACDHETSQLAFGCEGSELSVWNAHTGERIYLAKGAKPNRVGLMDKPWNTALAFVPGSRGRQLVVGTGQYKVRLYNLEQRRPVTSVDFGESRITAVAPSSKGQNCWIADSQGQIGCIDFKAGKVQQGLKGIAGSVRSLSIDAEESFVVSAGLDRYLRIHDLKTRRPTARVFLKHQLTGAVICPEDYKEPEEAAPTELEGCEEALFDQQLPERKRKKKKRRKQLVEGEQVSKKGKT